MITFRAPVTLPLLRAGTPKPVPPDPRAYDTFRVTQRFGDEDFYWAERDRQAGRTPRLHLATDIGNFRCGEPVVAMAPGIAYPVNDGAGALGVRIDHGLGVTSEHWHLNRVDVYPGQPVNSGFQIGIVGSTGLGDVCHTHIEVKVNGVRIDPEPLMFGGSLMEDTVLAFGANQLKTIANSPEFTISADAWFRSEPRLTDETKIEVLKAGTVIRSSYLVTGDKAGESDQWVGPAYKWADGKYRPGFVHSSVVTLKVQTPGDSWAAIQKQAATVLRSIESTAGDAAAAIEAKKP